MNDKDIRKSDNIDIAAEKAAAAAAAALRRAEKKQQLASNKNTATRSKSSSLKQPAKSLKQTGKTKRTAASKQGEANYVKKARTIRSEKLAESENQALRRKASSSAKTAYATRSRAENHSKSQRTSSVTQSGSEAYRRTSQKKTSTSSSSKTHARPLPGAQSYGVTSKKKADAKKSKDGDRQKKILLALVCVFILAAAFFLQAYVTYSKGKRNNPVAMAENEDEERSSESSSSLTSDKNTAFPEGLKLANLDLGGLSKREAGELINKNKTQLLDLIHFRLEYEDKSYDLKAKDMGATIDVEKVLEKLNHVVKDKSADSAVLLPFEIDKIITQGEIEKIAEELNKEPKSANEADSFDIDNLKFVYSKAEAGYVLNEKKLFNQLKTLAEEGEYVAEIELQLEKTEAEKSKVAEDIEIALIAQAQTTVTYHDAGRNQNLNRAAELINGYVLNPGKEFSFNEVMGDLTHANGFELAGMQADGVNIEGMAGGICQASTTVFQAAALAGLQISEHHNHDIPSDYCNLGEDAMVSDWADLKIINNSDHPIAFLGWFDGSTLHFQVYGKPLPAGNSYSFRVDYESSLAPGEDIKIENPSLPAGTVNVVRKRTEGHITKLYRILSVNGQPQSEEMIARNVYPAFAAKIEVNSEGKPEENGSESQEEQEGSVDPLQRFFENTINNDNYNNNNNNGGYYNRPFEPVSPNPNDRPHEDINPLDRFFDN